MVAHIRIRSEIYVLAGQSCIIVPKDGDKKLTSKTYDFGDFWFKDLEVGKYSLTIEAKGFPAKTIDNISTENDVNLGDIALS
jgi:hypothetical protein